MDWLNGIVAILTADDRTAGTGFVVASRLEKETLILTCTHVLEGAGYSFKNDEAVKVRFQANGQELIVYLAKEWSKPSVAEDVAVLYLTDPVPRGVEKLPLVAAAGCQHQSTQAFGYPVGTYGQRGDGKVLGFTPNPVKKPPHRVIQLSSNEITKGYSGAPVWSFHWECVLGMVCAGQKPDGLGRQGEVTYITPSEALVNICSELQLQVLFKMPFPRNRDFVGREAELEELHKTLRKSKTLAIAPTGLTGMGGIGKTQLAVEYAYRHQKDYPDGVFWLNATSPLPQEYANLGTWLRPDLTGQPLDTQLKAVTSYLRDYPNCLFILDNLSDSALLDIPLGGDLIPSQLPGRLLFTTRQRQISKYQSFNLSVLTEEAALQLLLRHRPEPLELETAKQICRTVGYLPLALKVAGAFLEEYLEISLDGFLTRMYEEGRLATLDEEAALSQRHELAVGIVLQAQWDALKDENARLLLRVAGQLSEAIQVSTDLLGVLAGVTDESRPGRPSPLNRALKQLETRALVEELQGESLRLHPLVWEFAQLQTPSEQAVMFQHECASRLAEAYTDFPTLARHYARRGIYALQKDVLHALAFYRAGTTALNSTSDLAYQRLKILLRLLQREAHTLWPSQDDRVLYQQLVYRLIDMDQPVFFNGVTNISKRFQQPFFEPVWLRRQESRAIERTLVGHTGSVKAVAVTFNGDRAISASDDQTLKVWNLRTGAVEMTLTGHGAAVLAVSVTPDGTRAISASADTTLKVWDLATGAEERTFKGHNNQVNMVAITPDSKRAISASDDCTLKLWSINTGLVERTLKGHLDWVNGVSITPNGTKVISACDDGALTFWDLATGVSSRTLQAHSISILGLALAPDGSFAITGDDYGIIKIWDLITESEKWTLSGYSGSVSSLVVCPDGRQAISASLDGTLKVWNLDSWVVDQAVDGHTKSVNALALTPDERLVISASDDRTLKVWKLDTGVLERTITGHDIFGLRGVAVTPDGHRVVSSSLDGMLYVWNLSSGTLEQRLESHTEWVLAVAIFSDSRRAISASRDKALKVWNLHTAREEQKLVGHVHGVTSVVITPSDKRAISTSWDWTLKVWDLTVGAEERTLSGHEGGVNSVAITSDGNRVISASTDWTLKVWDLTVGVEERTLSGHKGEVSSVVT